MNTVIKIFLSMSFSGSLLILALFFGKRFLKDRISRQWQYYIWLIVILRLLLPFGPEANLMGKTYETIGNGIARAALLPGQQNLTDIPEDLSVSAADPEQGKEHADGSADILTAANPLQDLLPLLSRHVWLVWLIVTAGLLIRKVTVYQSFIRYIKAGSVLVSDVDMLDRLSVTAEQAGVKRPVELSVDPLISSPMLIGFFHPCIVLPSKEISEKDFSYIALHELIHYKRGDMFYKWLTQLTVCLHWFNPLVYLMSREITKACEFSCDEAVLANIGDSSAGDYGKTLLDAMAAAGKYREALGAVTLSENKQLLKERLNAIMNFRKKSKKVRILTGILTICIILGAAFLGVYPAEAAEDTLWPADISRVTAEAKQYYKDGSLPLFQAAFSRLDEDAQSAWLDKIYADGKIAFFSVSVNQLDADSPLIGSFAEKLYKDGSVSFFSVLSSRMSRKMLKTWLDRALEDQKTSFQSVLFKNLEMDDELDALEEELAKKQLEEYLAAGVVKSGANYYYQGQLVNVFLDHQPNSSFYTLNINPTGTISIKILRKEDGQITGAACMTKEEVTELLGDMSGTYAAAPDQTLENTFVQDASAADSGDIVLKLSSSGQNSITQSGSFEADDSQVLTLTVQSDITGGSVDFFLFSPDYKEQRITLSGSDETKIITLSAGRWAYNCTGFFESGDITIIGRKRDH